MRFKIDRASLRGGSKFTVFGLFYFVFEGNFPSRAPRGTYIWRDELRWLNTVLRAVSGNSRGGACFKLEKQTWRRKKQWYREDDFSKSTH